MNLSTLCIIVILLAITLWRQADSHKPSLPVPKHFYPRPKPQPPAEPQPRRRKNAKPPWVPDTLIELARRSPLCGCRALANLFNRTYHEIGISVGKTYVSNILRKYRLTLTQPQRYAHDIDTACPSRTVWGIDMTGYRWSANISQLIFGIIDHGSRRVLKLQTIREKSSNALLRLLLDAIEHYGKPKKIRTDNEAVFTSWVFAFALRWLGIRHQRTMPGQPWMNGRIERVWSTFKQLLRMFDIRNEAELQATLELLRDTYNQHRPHQSLSGYTPIEAWHIFERRKTKPKRPRRR
jgi:putative transposase